MNDNHMLNAETLAGLMTRNDDASGRRLLAHLASILSALLVAAATSGTLWVVLPTLALAFFLGTIFAPFHECTHSTAFATPAYNRWGAILTGVLYGMSWHNFRVFHFQHHSHTQDPEKDPEIMMDPQHLSPWPGTPSRWLITLSGIRFLAFKIIGMSTCWIPGLTNRFAYQSAMAEARIVSLVWLFILAAALYGIPGATPLVVAFLLANTVQGMWLTAEHSGCSEDGSILERTRSIHSNALVRFFLWNMNYHSEHHAWPGVPWHALPALHEQLGQQVDAQPGYLQVYRSAFG